MEHEPQSREYARHKIGGRGVTRTELEMHPPGSPERAQMIKAHHANTLWISWLIIILGFWLLSSPFAYGYLRSTILPAAPDAAPFPLEWRRIGMLWSDLASGAFLIIFGFRCLKPERYLSAWGACLVGIWLNAAPLVFWAPSAAAYLNSTFIGVLVVALTVLIPGMPGMLKIMEHGPVVPPGWTYNPSSWPQRAVMIALGFAGWLVSRQLACYQMGYTDAAWEPFFGEGTKRVLTSDMSKMWPISDAGLGAFAYTFEMLMGFMGGPARWRTMPWMVTFFGILVIPLGLTHIFLVISQPLVVGEWCTLCLLAATIMLPMIPLEGDEVVAMIQFLVKTKRSGQSLWHTFWFGGTVEGGGPDERSPEMTAPVRHLVPAGLWGMSLPWTLASGVVLGLGLVLIPLFLQMPKSLQDISHLGGLLTVTVGVVSMGEVFRMCRWGNVLIGLGLTVAVIALDNVPTAVVASVGIIGLAIAALNVPRGAIRERYDGWTASVMRSPAGRLATRWRGRWPVDVS